MEYLLIVYGSSSAYLYVQEAWLRGMKPIILYPPTSKKGDNEPFLKRIGDNAEIFYLKEQPETDPLMEKLKKYNIVCAVAGSEGGTRYADRVANILGLKCNDPETIWRRSTKNGMHQSLKEAGIRYIKSIVIQSEDDVRKFWKENKLKKGMVKNTESASSVGNKVVYSPEDAIEHYNFLKNNPNLFGIKTEVILQEFIEGEEYIVDSVSCEGKHMITDIWKYNKILTKDNDVIYDSTFLITNLDGEVYNLVKYAFKVLDATGFKYGPCHGEYKIDENGPVLIETNARPIGLAMNHEYLDECLGHHVTNISLDSYLYPKMFEQHKLKPYHPNRFAVMKSLITNEDFDANIKPLGIILGMLKSYRYMNTIEDKKIHVPKTIDLQTSIITIKMCHKDKSVVEKELRLIDIIEKHPELVKEFEKDSKLIQVKSDWKKLFQYIPRDRKILVVTNEDRHMVWFGKEMEIDNNWDSYDNLIYAYTGGKKLSEIYSSFLRDAAKIRHGGMIVIVPEFIEKVPCGAIGAQMLLSVAGFLLEMPIFGFEKYMVAVKTVD